MKLNGHILSFDPWYQRWTAQFNMHSSLTWPHYIINPCYIPMTRNPHKPNGFPIPLSSRMRQQLYQGSDTWQLWRQYETELDKISNTIGNFRRFPLRISCVLQFAMQTQTSLLIEVYSLRLSNTIWRHKSGSTLAPVMACCLTAPSHYLNKCWLIISKVQWHPSQSNFTKDTSAISHWKQFENYLSKMFFKSPKGQWVNIV